MGKRVKKRSRALQKEKRVTHHSPKIAPQQTTPAEDITDGGVEVVKVKKLCSHLEKGFNFNNLSEKFGASGPLKCEGCREGALGKRVGRGKGKNGKNKGSADSKSVSKAIWICLECGYYGCGGIGLPTVPQSHAVRHARLSHHPLAIQWENPHLRWCFPCNTLIPVETVDASGEKKDVLSNVVKLIKTQSLEKSSVAGKDIWFGGGSVASEIKAEGTTLSNLDGRSSYMVRGLTNLGNTCFLNSVMQNLMSMDKFWDFFFDQDPSFGPLTIALKKHLTKTKSDMVSKSVINPQSFFESVCARGPQYKGYQQHDSHEFLRFLLDGIDNEELDVRKRKNVPKEDGISLNHEPTFVESLFGGRFSSTISCNVCPYSSTRYEVFCDLSLPVPTKKPPSKRAQPVSRPKKSKLPPKRLGKLPGKVNKDTSSVPASKESQSQKLLVVPHAEKVVAPSGDAAGSDSFCLTSLGDKSGLASQNLSTGPHAEINQAEEVKVGQLAADDTTWMDILQPETITNDPNSISEHNDVSIDQHSNSMTPNDGLVENSPLFSVDGEATQNPDSSSVNLREEEVLLQVSSSEVLLLPYKEESITDGEKMREEAGPPSAVVADQDDAEFYGVSDLFNEPEVSSGPVAGPPLENETARTVFTGEKGSDSDPDEVDNSDSPVSIESCLAHYTKPELLSNDNAWKCEKCTGLQHQMLEAKKKQSKTAFANMSNVGETQVQNHPPNFDKDNLCSTDVRDLHDGDTNTANLLNFTGESLLFNNGKVNCSSQNCGKTESKKTDNLKPIVSESEVQKGDAPVASLEQSHSLYESCSQESFSSPAINPYSADEASSTSTGYKTAKDLQDGPQLSGNSQSEGAEDEERTSKKEKVKSGATKRLLFDVIPPVLTLQLQRFKQDLQGRTSKLNGHVNFGEMLDMRPYLHPRWEVEKYEYRLIGVVEHKGSSMNKGHYIAYVRGRSKGKGENENGDSVWYYTSDTSVREASLEEVLRCDAYILFYEKV